MNFSIRTILLSFLAAAVISIISIYRKKQFHKRLIVLRNYLSKIYLLKGQREKEPGWYHYDSSGKVRGEGVIYFSVAILVGFIIAKLLTDFYPF